LPSQVRRRGKRILAFAGKPGRGLCQYVTRHLDLTQFSPQFNEFLVFLGVQGFNVDWKCCNCSATGLAYPARNAGGMTTKFFGLFFSVGKCPRNEVNFNVHLFQENLLARLLCVQIELQVDLS
jgi:hypothetical protein